jgi:acylphosphatase
MNKSSLVPPSSLAMGMALVCKRVIYSGHVQGVGFRYTAQSLAAGYPIAGYVRNLPSGEVEMVAEGESDSVEAFLAAVARRMASYITNTTVQDGAPSGQSGFLIRR